MKIGGGAKNEQGIDICMWYGNWDCDPSGKKAGGMTGRINNRKV